jgi:hypothetical protein
VTAEEAQDNTVPGCGGKGRADGGDVMDPAAAWRRTGWRWK